MTSEFDVIVVGGGPAGSTAAWKLRLGGMRVLVLDREPFPRLKLCAGWVTPEALKDLEIEPADYPHRLLSFRRLHFHAWGLHLPAPCVQHSIRRLEFDAWLLARSGAEVRQHAVSDIREEREGYLIDERYRARYLIASNCPFAPFALVIRCPVLAAVAAGLPVRSMTSARRSPALTAWNAGPAYCPRCR